MRYPFFSQKFFRNFLIFLLILNMLSAFYGGIGLIFFNGLGMLSSWIEDSFLKSWIWPGLILFLIVGGTQLAALIGNVKKSRFSTELGLVAGFGLLIWIYVEICIIKEVSILQTVYFLSGIAVILLSYLTYRAKNDF